MSLLNESLLWVVATWRSPLVNITYWFKFAMLVCELGKDLGADMYVRMCLRYVMCTVRLLMKLTSFSDPAKTNAYGWYENDYELLHGRALFWMSIFHGAARFCAGPLSEYRNSRSQQASSNALFSAPPRNCSVEEANGSKLRGPHHAPDMRFLLLQTRVRIG
jgi:hypothetical protein